MVYKDEREYIEAAEERIKRLDLNSPFTRSYILEEVLKAMAWQNKETGRSLSEVMNNLKAKDL